MSSLIVIAQLKTNGGQDRQKVLAALGKAAEYSASKEPGVVKYCIALPRDDDGTSVFAIEEYIPLPYLSHPGRRNKLNNLDIHHNQPWTCT